jgi:Leucine-rich repeat (LRR) protein
MARDDSVFLTSSPEEGRKIALQRIENFRAGRTFPDDRLVLAQLGLTEVPLEVFEVADEPFIHLRELDLQFNRLRNIPYEIKQLSELHTLLLYWNDFETFPLPATFLDNLQVLTLDRNLIGHLPPEIGKLTSLKRLQLTHNRIRTLPIQMTRLNQLTSITLSDNPIAELQLTIHVHDEGSNVSIPFCSYLKHQGIKNTVRALHEQHGPATLFLSYARQDQHHVEQIRQFLLDAGHQVWMDVYNVVGGENWERAIRKAIGECTIFAAVISRNSVNRRGMVQKELKIALDEMDGMMPNDIFVIPVRLDDCEIPERLSQFQSVQWGTSAQKHSLLEAIDASLERRMQKNC